MEFLAAHNIAGISLSKAFAERDRSGSFPDQAVVLTFDDGYLSLLDAVLPVTSKLGFSATAFVMPDLVGLSVSQLCARNSAIDRALMGWNDIEELVRYGFEIGSHSCTHPDLRRLTEAELERELSNSKTRLEQKLQVAIESLAYPFGFFNPAVRDNAARHYIRACTVRLGHAGSDEDDYTLKRIDGYYLQRQHRFEKACQGGLGSYLGFRQILRDFKQELMQR